MKVEHREPPGSALASERTISRVRKMEARRRALLDGVLRIESPPGRGTVVRAELPTRAGKPPPAARDR